MPQFSFCSTFHNAGAHCTTRHCIKDCVFGSLTLGCACIASVYFLELVFSIPRDRPRIILLLRCSVAGSPVRNPGSLSLVGNDPQKKPFICLSPACTSQQSQLSCNNLSFNCTLKSNSSAALLYINPKNDPIRSLSSYFSCTSPTLVKLAIIFFFMFTSQFQTMTKSGKSKRITQIHIFLLTRIKN